MRALSSRGLSILWLSTLPNFPPLFRERSRKSVTGIVGKGNKIIHKRRRHFLPAASHDLFLPLYDPLMSLLGGKRAQQDLLDHANVNPAHTILDIGCGTGTLIIMLKQQSRSARVVGIDPDPNALRRARSNAKRAAVSVQLNRGFADELPYADNSLDRVFSSFMFHHLEEQDRERALSEVSRVLKRDGSFWLLDVAAGDHAWHGGVERLIHSSERLKDNSQQRILELMARAGFTKAAKFKDGRMLFGMLRTAYYRASF